MRPSVGGEKAAIVGSLLVFAGAEEDAFSVDDDFCGDSICWYSSHGRSRSVLHNVLVLRMWAW